MPGSDDFITRAEFEELKRQIDEKFAFQENFFDKCCDDFLRRF